MTTQLETIKRPHRASNMQRAKLCPPSVWREMDMPEMPAGDAADEGTMLHAAVKPALLDGDYSGLNPNQAWAVKQCVKFIEDIGITGADESWFERQLPVLDSDCNKIIDRDVHLDFSGLCDDGTGNANVCEVIDFKFGYKPIPFDAAHDLQGLTYAIAAHHAFNVDTVVFHRLQPRLPSDERWTCVNYSGDETYWRSLEDVLRRIVAKSTPDAKARPGVYQCQYCKAAMICKEFREWAERDIVALKMPVAEIQERASMLTGEALATVCAYKEKVKLLDNMVKAAESEAVRRIEMGAEVPGYTIDQGKMRRSIPDASMARSALSEVMPSDVFDQVCSVGIGDLESAFRAVTGLKGKAASTRLAEVLGDAMKTNQDRPSLKRITEKQLE